MEKERLNLFKAEFNAQVKKIDEIYERIKERSKIIETGAVALESLSYQLHNLYCAYEDLFKITADFFENRIEEKANYHTQLLRRMSLEIEGLRPALLSEQSYILLDELRAFRHFFRHAYLYRLDPDRVKIALEKALRLKDIFETDSQNFLRKLEFI